MKLLQFGTVWWIQIERIIVYFQWCWAFQEECYQEGSVDNFTNINAENGKFRVTF
jgi:hypothetical protein